MEGCRGRRGWTLLSLAHSSLTGCSDMRQGGHEARGRLHSQGRPWGNLS